MVHRESSRLKAGLCFRPRGSVKRWSATFSPETRPLPSSPGILTLLGHQCHPGGPEEVPFKCPRAVTQRDLSVNSWRSGEESACQCGRHRSLGFLPWLRKIPWGRKWLPSPVFLPGKSYGQKSLAGCNPRDCRVRHD